MFGLRSIGNIASVFPSSKIVKKWICSKSQSSHFEVRNEIWFDPVELSALSASQLSTEELIRNEWQNLIHETCRDFIFIFHDP